MTRINVIHPSLLTRQHLLAEWHEIGRIITLAESGVNPKDIPAKYTLGKGHMKFFVDKLSYISLRIGLLSLEMRERGYAVDVSKQLDMIARCIIAGFGTHWFPDTQDIALNLSRLVERDPNHEPYREELATLMMEYAL